MGFFSDRYSRPGPGVSPNAPRKKGFARLFEILGRDLWSFFRAGFLALLACIPFIICMIFAVDSHALIFVLVGGIAGGMIAGPFLSAMADTVLRSLRDEPGFWWQTYRRVLKRNARQSLVPGLLTGLVTGIQIFTLFHLSDTDAGLGTWLMLLVSILLVLGLETYIWPQIALLDLPMSGLLKNSVLLFLGFLPRSAGAMLMQAVYWGFILLFYPVSLLLLPFTNFWLPMVPSLLCVYKALDKSFSIESTIKQMREDDLNTAIASGGSTSVARAAARPAPTPQPEQAAPELPEDPQGPDAQG